ncbi:sensor histidine kinase [Ramlibacter henchirensis]|uniref:Sensor histidine kinase n=1 Tax=Ramlibacter henchirensis TaxID=204072 RepID=A0A4Z0BW77_9BURK|nr:histidine kinase [Ramlibacter henchirensis]TFZ02259.1 sensor histidine kinase [Ramlibacter henchirensis]
MSAPPADRPLPLFPVVRIDPRAKLRHLLQTWLFCIAIAVLQYAFEPNKPFLPNLAFSVSIGSFSWAVVDLGRHFFPSSRETGWPDRLPGLVLVLAGIAAGYLGGTSLGDALCRTFGWYGEVAPVHSATDRRSALLITTMAGIVASYYFYSVSRGHYLERQMAEARRHADEARLKLLETQLEPHMLFNTLANLRALIAVDPPRAQRMLDHMIAYLRATLDASRATTHPLQVEFDRVRDYLELMAIRMGPRLSYELDLPQELAQHPVPTLLLQPLVENAIQHGLEPKVEGGRLTVQARSDGGELVVVVSDTGVGLSGPVAQGHGFGLTQVRERLTTLYGPAARLSLDPLPSAPGEGWGGDTHGAQVTIRLPLRTQ